MDHGNRRRWMLSRRSRNNMFMHAAILAAAILGAPAGALACDICAIYTATQMRESRTGPRFGVAEQFSHFGTLQDNGEEVANPNDEFLDSSITQLLLGYQLTPRLGVQLNVPLISRTFRRAEENNPRARGAETGIGDLSLLGHVVAYANVTEHSVFRLSLLGGLKLPSGDSSRLQEEVEEGEEPGGLDSFDNPFSRITRSTSQGGGAHDEVASGVHGHDLALGSGSVDGVIGTQAFGSWDRFFLSGGVQYLLRTEGDFDYEYANDLTWNVSPGFFAVLRHDYSLGVNAVLSGETKGKDTQDGEKANDTGITSLYVGPGLNFTWGTSLHLDIAGDLPAVQNNTSLQIVPDFRIRGGVTWSF